MTTINRASGLQVKVPTRYHLVETTEARPPKGRRKLDRVFGPVPLPAEAGPAAAINDAVVAAFGNQEMELIDQVEFVPTAGSSRRGARKTSASNTAKLTVMLAPHEDAVILLEQDGVYSWQFASKSTTETSKPRRRGAPTVAVTHVVQFDIKLPVQTPAKRRRTRRGIIDDFILDNVKAFVFRFAARVAVGQIMKYLERNMRHGLVNMLDVEDPVQWDLTDGNSLKLPTDRPARILLFVHGTFSSTIGAYGSLTSTPWGQEFLRATHTNYDAVLGFDHPTLSEDPLENATELLDRLQAINWKNPPHIDVITHSRGGLVIRSLLEELLPIGNFRAHFERVIFVAATNGGTKLAEPDNWVTLIDLYTNIAVAACRLIGMNPQAKAVTVILNEIIRGLGALVKYCATTAISERAVPGLAAMEPEGEFVKKLNGEQQNQPTIAQSYYCAITSEFQPRIFGGEHEPKELPLRLLLWIADVLTRQLMKEGNDLVVNTASMTSVDPQLGKYIKDSIDFGANPHVYHTNYFVRPESINALARWLRLAPPGHRGEAALPAAVELTLAYWQPDLLEAGGLAGAEVPAAVDTDIVVTDASTLIREAINMIERAKPSYVVVRRPYLGKLLNYAVKPEEVIERAWIGRGKTSLLSALNLHETGSSETRSVTASMEPPTSSGGPGSSRRAVVVVGDQPVGVVPEKEVLPAGAELVSRARSVLVPKNVEEAIIARRTMPSFPSLREEDLMSEWRSAHSTLTAPRRRSTSRTRNQAKPSIVCHFRAEMEEEVLVRRPVTVEVVISRELIGKLISAAAKEGKAEIDPTRKLLIQVFPKVNFESVDDGWAEMDPPEPGAPQYLYFIVRATHVGEGEVWVIARQGQVPLVTLVLKPQIVKVRSTEIIRPTSAAATTEEAPRLEARLYQLFILERRQGEQLSYFYQFQGPDGELLPWQYSPPIRGSREQYVAKLYEEIEKRWLSSQEDVEDFTAELRAKGRAMLEELIPIDLQKALWERRNKLKSIMVVSEEPFIPWELVYLNEPGKPLSDEGRFLGQMGLVRWLHEAGWPPRNLRIRKGHARYVIPNYPHPDYELPEAEQEWKFLEENFGAAPVQPKSSAVRKLLSQNGGFDLLHFACHGIADQDDIANAQLLLEGRIEGPDYILDYFSATTVEQYANLRSKGYAPIIVLNACQTGRAGYKLTGVGGFAQAFLRRGAGTFVSTLWSVGDTPARSFTEEFYKQLLKGVTIAQATIRAREKARKAGDATWLAYVVYGHPHNTITS